MASNGGLTVSTPSPKSGSGEAPAANSPKGQYCLCSPTSHQGSFRCRFHRSLATMKRSNSMPANKSVASLSPKSVEST
ncbi:hypothetical protein L484_020811 [Morus notabilis]|uniref:Serine-rich protein n=1 Tax=Morus notabilis TaxID=981085 RepID=W9QGT2_9ROSA|nr:hypothetical protein L484_020811 [Morus notabilis]